PRLRWGSLAPMGLTRGCPRRCVRHICFAGFAGAAYAATHPRRRVRDACDPTCKSGRPPAVDGPRGTNRKALLALRRRVQRRGRAGAATTLRHELVELSLVLRHPQAREKILELALLLF